jgi:hypothetical protein
MATSSMVLLLAVHSNIFRRGFRPPGHGELDHRHAAVVASCRRLPHADRGADPDLFLLGWPFEWRPIILVVPADLLSGRQSAWTSDMV